MTETHESRHCSKRGKLDTVGAKDVWDRLAQALNDLIIHLVMTRLSMPSSFLGDSRDAPTSCIHKLCRYAFTNFANFTSILTIEPSLGEARTSFIRKLCHFHGYSCNEAGFRESAPRYALGASCGDGGVI